MSETFWEQGGALETQAEAAPAEPHAEQGSLAVSVDDFSALEQRVLRAVELVKQERQGRAAAEARAAEAEAKAKETEGQLHDQASVMEQMQAELTAHKAERDQVRQRVERLLQQLDELQL